MIRLKDIINEDKFNSFITSYKYWEIILGNEVYIQPTPPIQLTDGVYFIEFIIKKTTDEYVRISYEGIYEKQIIIGEIEDFIINSGIF